MPDENNFDQDRIHEMMRKRSQVKIALDPPGEPGDSLVTDVISQLPPGVSFDDKVLLSIISGTELAWSHSNDSIINKLRADSRIRMFTCPITGSYRYTRKDN